MTRPTTPAAPPIKALALALLVFGLGACEVRRDAAEVDEEVPSETPPTPDETGGASIIRDDIADTPATPLPPEPLDVTLPFAEGTELAPAAEELLEVVLKSDAFRRGWPISLAGHTDSGGSDEANLRASRARAENVAAWLIARGVPDERITIIAFGEQNPLVPNARPDGSPDELARRKNRRVELTIAPPLPMPPPEENNPEAAEEP